MSNAGTLTVQSDEMDAFDCEKYLYTNLCVSTGCVLLKACVLYLCISIMLMYILAKVIFFNGIKVFENFCKTQQFDIRDVTRI